MVASTRNDRTGYPHATGSRQGAEGPTDAAECDSGGRDAGNPVRQSGAPLSSGPRALPGKIRERVSRSRQQNNLYHEG